MTKYVVLACAVWMMSVTGCGGHSGGVVVDRESAKELYDSEEVRAKEAAAAAAAEQAAAAGGE